VDSEVAGDVVRLDTDSFFGLLAVTNAVPPGLMPLRRTDDLHVYASVEKEHMRFYFAIKHRGIWRAVEGLYSERIWGVELWRKEREVLEAIRGAVEKVLTKLGHSTVIWMPEEVRDIKGNIRAYRLSLYSSKLTPFLERAAERIETGPAEVQLEDGRIIMRTDGVEAAIEFKLLKDGETLYLFVNDIEHILALYKSLRALGVPVEITPKGIRMDREAMWALIAATVERSTPSGLSVEVAPGVELFKLPAEVLPGVKLLNMYNANDMKLYVFHAEDVHYYFAVKTKEGWKIAGGKKTVGQIIIYGQAAETVAKAVSAIYSHMGVKGRVEVKYRKKDGEPYILLTSEDLKLLGIR